MRVLVTGAGGFLGTAITRMLVDCGHEVRGFSRTRYPHLETLGVVQYRGDLADPQAVESAVQGCDQVYHVAALAGSAGPYRRYLDTNVRGTEHVLAACRRHGVHDLIYTSTPSVVSCGRDLEGVDESTPYSDNFRAHYPLTKAAAEKLLLAASSTELRTVALRPHLVWGPNDTSLLPRLVSRARKGKLKRIGNADKLIDVTYIDDAAKAHLLAGEKLSHDAAGVAGKAYFISSGQPVETWTMINRLLEATGSPTVEKRISKGLAKAAGWMFESAYSLLRLRGEPPITRWVVDELATSHWFDISAARRDLGYEPSVSLDEGMERLRAWWESTGRTGGRSATRDQKIA